MVDINSLLQTAQDEETFDNITTFDVIKATGIQNLQQNFGMAADNFKCNEALLVSLLLDDSWSIAEFDGEESICDGQNLFVDQMLKFKDRKDVLVEQVLMNKGVLHSFTEISNVIRLVNNNNYQIGGYTPLYRKLCERLGTMVLKAKVEYAECGFPCRCIMAVVSDGENCDPNNNNFTSDNVKTLVDELGESLIMYFVGIQNNKRVDFVKIAEAIGVPSKNILTPNSDPDSIARAFNTISRTISNATKSAKNFTKAASIGGFIDD